MANGLTLAFAAACAIREHKRQNQSSRAGGKGGASHVAFTARGVTGRLLSAPVRAIAGLFQAVPPDEPKMETEMNNSYIGLWVTGDGHVRQHLLANGRYVEARGNRERAYEGRYQLKGDHIEYIDDSGVVAAGDFQNGILYHGGMVLYRD